MLRFVLATAAAALAAAQPPKGAAPRKLDFHFEFRTRFEARQGVSFGRDPNSEFPLLRTRVGVDYHPTPWMRWSALAQDSRAPFYGSPAPGTLRDTLDLQEGFLELGRESGPSLLLGRQMVELGETRLIGAPQWLNTARTYDSLRLAHRRPDRDWQVLWLSVVKVRPDSFDLPNLGDRIWGTYNTFRKLIPDGDFEWYLLRHDQNQPGGFAGPGRLGVNLFGARVVTPLGRGFRLSVEAVGQTGKVGGKQHRAAAWFSSVSREVKLARPVTFSGEYKYASGTDDPEGGRSGTFDQLYPANHDKFGHADLFGWRNIHNVRSLETIQLTRAWRLFVMWDASWLASPRDALYNGPGRPLARAPLGDAGRYVGQEIDCFTTYRRGPFRLGAGVAKLFAGEFLRRTTPGANTLFFYVFQGVSFGRR